MYQMFRFFNYRMLAPLDKGGEDGGGAGEDDRGDTVDPAKVKEAKQERVGGGKAGDKPKEPDEDEEPEEKETPEEEEIPEEDEEKETPEEEEIPEEDEDTEGKDNKTVPRGRLNQVIRQRETYKESSELERQRSTLLANENAKLKEQLAAKDNPPPKPYDFVKAEAAYIKAIQDNEPDVAAKLRAEIRVEERKEFAAEAKTSATSTTAAALEEQRVDSIIKQSETDYPMLKPKNKDYDEERVDDIIALQAGYISAGQKPSDALAKAIAKVMKDVKPVGEGLKQGLKKTTIPAKTDKEKTAERVDAAGKQPPKLKGGDKGKPAYDNLDFSKMSDEEIEALPKSVLRKLRGDQ